MLSNIRIPIYRQIQDYIRHGIDVGNFLPGERLPSEIELAQRFGTTRATVARAFQELSFDGLVVRKIGSGTYVSAPNADNLDINEAIGQDERASAAGLQVSYELLDYSCTRAPDKIAKLLGVSTHTQVYRMQRLRRTEGNAAVEDRYLPEYIGARLPPDSLTQYPVQQLLRDHLGLRISHIDNVVRASLATQELSFRLGVRRGSALLVRQHVIYDLQDRPVLCGETIYSDEFSIRYVQRNRL